MIDEECERYRFCNIFFVSLENEAIDSILQHLQSEWKNACTVCSKDEDLGSVNKKEFVSAVFRIKNR